MAGTSGLEMARWLYDRGVRDRVVFITGNPEYALAGYDAHPLHYLLKPVDRERLEAALHLALEKRRPPDHPPPVGRQDRRPALGGDPLGGEPGPRRGGLPGGGGSGPSPSPSGTRSGCSPGPPSGGATRVTW